VYFAPRMEWFPLELGILALVTDKDPRPTALRRSVKMHTLILILAILSAISLGFIIIGLHV